MTQKFKLTIIIVLFFIFFASIAAAQTISVTQGEKVTLTLKLVNVGDVTLKDVKAQFEQNTTPNWITPVQESSFAVNLSVKTEEQSRPFALLPFVFTVDKNAPLGKEYLLTFLLNDADGHYWKKHILLNVLERPKPKSFRLMQNFPNPFNPETWIPFQLAEDSDVTIKIFDINGRLVKTLELGYKEADFYFTRSSAAYWDGKNNLGEQVASGVYFYHLQAGKETAIRKMLILK